MKRFLTMLLTWSLIFTLAACKRETPAVSQTTSDDQTSHAVEAGTENASVVYMTTDISAAGLMAVYQALDWTPTGKVAVKLSTGEPPASNFLRPELVGELIRFVDGTIVECNTAYGGSRAETAMHYQVAEDHGFTAIADFQILDENGSMTLPVEGGSHLTENDVGASFADYDSYLVLSHFKGHTMAGYGGAIKNISIGLGSSEGKAWIHSAGTSHSNIWGGDQDHFLESMAEPDMHDIGILASTDPVALDQACMIWFMLHRMENRSSIVLRVVTGSTHSNMPNKSV